METFPFPAFSHSGREILLPARISRSFFPLLELQSLHPINQRSLYPLLEPAHQQPASLPSTPEITVVYESPAGPRQSAPAPASQPSRLGRGAPTTHEELSTEALLEVTPHGPATGTITQPDNAPRIKV